MRTVQATTYHSSIHTPYFIYRGLRRVMYLFPFSKLRGAVELVACLRPRALSQRHFLPDGKRGKWGVYSDPNKVR